MPDELKPCAACEDAAKICEMLAEGYGISEYAFFLAQQSSFHTAAKLIRSSCRHQLSNAAPNALEIAERVREACATLCVITPFREARVEHQKTRDGTRRTIQAAIRALDLSAVAGEQVNAVPCKVCGKTPPFPGGTRCQRTDCGLIEWAGTAPASPAPCDRCEDALPLRYQESSNRDYMEYYSLYSATGELVADVYEKEWADRIVALSCRHSPAPLAGLPSSSTTRCARCGTAQTVEFHYELNAAERRMKERHEKELAAIRVECKQVAELLEKRATSAESSAAALRERLEAVERALNSANDLWSRGRSHAAWQLQHAEAIALAAEGRKP